jgi:two-component system response regulator MprA
MRVLLVEDDRELASLVCRALKEESDTVTVCHDGAAGLRAAERSEFDIVVLDIMLPFMDGLEVTRRLRLGSVRTPILLLTGRDAPEDIVRGLDAGADDYLTKPFSFEVLHARLRARTRSAAHSNSRRRFADLTIDLEKHEAWRGDTPLALTRTEFAILECLMRSARRTVTRDSLIESVWGDREVTNNNLDVFVRFLRVKVDLPNHTKLIHTVRGIGFTLQEGEG